ncbi:Uncharacterised protein [Mycobacteroides abscessus subsp. abscessus]|nr:Uncharacterised protein [Mycobacteroides abscessus subsp. abscessus]
MASGSRNSSCAVMSNVGGYASTGTATTRRSPANSTGPLSNLGASFLNLPLGRYASWRLVLAGLAAKSRSNSGE